MSMISVRDERLYSVNCSEISTALYELGSRRDLPPNDQEIAQLLLLLRHSDAEIREVAVSTAGVHWRLESSYPILKNMVAREEKDQMVLTTACLALGALVGKGIGNIEEVSSIIALIVLNKQLDPTLRSTAYTELKRMYDPIGWAVASHDIEELNFDSEWVKSLI